MLSKKNFKIPKVFTENLLQKYIVYSIKVFTSELWRVSYLNCVQTSFKVTICPLKTSLSHQPTTQSTLCRCNKCCLATRRSRSQSMFLIRCWLIVAHSVLPPLSLFHLCFFTLLSPVSFPIKNLMQMSSRVKRDALGGCSVAINAATGAQNERNAAGWGGSQQTDQTRPEQSKEWASCAIMWERRGKRSRGRRRGVCIYMPCNFYFYFGRQKRNVPPKVKIKQKCWPPAHTRKGVALRLLKEREVETERDRGREGGCVVGKGQNCIYLTSACPEGPKNNCGWPATKQSESRSRQTGRSGHENAQARRVWEQKREREGENSAKKAREK